MGTLAVEKSTLQAMMLEILLRDKEFFRDILREIIKKDPNCLEEFTSKATPVHVGNVSVQNAQKPETEDVSDEELNFWVDQHFKEYDEVFKALA